MREASTFFDNLHIMKNLILDFRNKHLRPQKMQFLDIGIRFELVMLQTSYYMHSFCIDLLNQNTLIVLLFHVWFKKSNLPHCLLSTSKGNLINQQLSEKGVYHL